MDKLTVPIRPILTAIRDAKMEIPGKRISTIAVPQLGADWRPNTPLQTPNGAELVRLTERPPPRRQRLSSRAVVRST